MSNHPYPWQPYSVGFEDCPQVKAARRRLDVVLIQATLENFFAYREMLETLEKSRIEKNQEYALIIKRSWIIKARTSEVDNVTRFTAFLKKYQQTETSSMLKRIFAAPVRASEEHIKIIDIALENSKNGPNPFEEYRNTLLYRCRIRVVDLTFDLL